MAGVRLDAVLRGERGAICDALQLDRALLALEMGETASVEFDDRCAEADGGSDLFLRRLDEEADADVRGAQSVDIISEVVVLPGGVQPALGGALLALFGDNAGGVRAVRQRDLQHLLGRRHLEVQRQVDLGHQPVDVAVGDVPPVFAQVGGDAIGAGVGGHDCRAHRIGMVAAARVSNSRDMVDIDAEAQSILSLSKGHAAARLPGFIGGIAASSGGTESAS